jgi:hypothetical protein
MFSMEAVLPNYSAVKLLIVSMAGSLLFLLHAGIVQSQSGEAVFTGIKKLDRVSSTSPAPDGKSDAVFSVNLGALKSNVVEIELRTTSGPSHIWSTQQGRSGTSFLGVASAKNPAEIINTQPGKLDLSGSDTDLLLFATDDGQFAAGKNFQVRASLKNGSSTNIQVASQPSQRENQDLSGKYPVRMSAMLKGVSQYDAVNPGKIIKGDDKADGLFQLTIEAGEKEITAIEIRNTDGTPAVWDTIPSNTSGAIGVALTSDPVKLINRRDGSVSIPVKGKTEFNLYVADNGSISGGQTNFRISVTFSDSTVAWSPVQKASPPSSDAKPGSAPSKVNLAATWLGFVSTDAVGKYQGLKPDGSADTVFGVDIEIVPKNTIIGFEINSLEASGVKWSTSSSGGNAWSLGVAYQTAPTALLNKSDGSINIPIEGRVQLYLYAADPGDIASSGKSLRVIVFLSDGTSYQQPIRKPPSTTSTVVPGGEEPPKTKGNISSDFRGFIADLVNTSTKPGKDGYLDGTFILKIQVDDKTVARVDISGPDGLIRWSSDPKPPTMFLGVALYPKIYKLLNEKGGKFQSPVTGRKTLYLYAADNGLLSDPKARLTATVTFTDKSTLSSEVIK